MRFWLRLLGVALAGMVLGLLIAVILLAGWLHAPQHHATVIVRYLLASGILSLLAGVGSLLAAARLAPRLGIKIALASLVGSVAALVTLLATPLLMFSEPADKYILVITLLYFLAISLALAIVVGLIVSKPIKALHEGALRLASGQFDTRVAVDGIDEVADLAKTFNRMSAELGESFARQRHMEHERRQMMAAVSHDLRTPLASLRAMIEAINDGVVSEPAEVSRYLRLMQQESENLGRLIDDLFELVRLESGSLELRLASVPLTELVLETVEGLSMQARAAGIELQAHCPPNLPALAIDGPRMQRALVNLIENALHHTPTGGRVDVEVRATGEHIELAVTDTGSGIAPEDRAHVFERFYRSDKARSRLHDGSGAGLGLAIARGIVEAHRGSIHVESPPGKGARFVVQL